VYLRKIVANAKCDNKAMLEVQGYIRDGANAFLRRQYKTLFLFVFSFVFVILAIYATTYEADKLMWLYISIAYISGSSASAAAGWIGMKVGVDANAKTSQASESGLPAAFNVSFFGGAVMGMLVTGCALGGVWLFYYIYSYPIIVLGFSLGASSIALFAKAGGGIYTKTADVGADLVGKIEYSLPEDDPRNPAAIADNVGDNVGDIAGMGADLFDSYVASMVAAMMLGFSIMDYGATGIDAITFASFPLVTSAAGLFASICGIFIVKKMVTTSPGKALNNGTYISTFIFILFGAAFTAIICSTNGITDELKTHMWRCYGAGVFGVIAGLIIGLSTDYFTDDSKPPTQKTAEAAQQGHALTILTGFSYGLMSIAAPVIGVAIAMMIAYYLDGVYAIANSAVGMLAIVGTIVSNDAYGPIVDNARGIAEHGHLSEEHIKICDELDSAGNTAKAITKGFAIGAAALTVLALLYSYMEEARQLVTGGFSLDLMAPNVMVGALLGTVIPCIYAAVLIMAVNKNAQLMVKEIRRQFESEPRILKGEVAADFAKCIDIATAGALKELIIPIVLAIGSPILIGVFFGIAALGAFLTATILTGLVFALLLSNAGGTWDNAKKYIEDGHFGGKGTLAHAAAVTGDTVGDPFKDTAGPSINTLICVISLTASMFLTAFSKINGGNGLFEAAWTPLE